MRGPLENAFAKLAALPYIGVAAGDVFRVPSGYLSFKSDRPFRFCVVVALQTLPDDQNPSIAHVIVGSTRPDVVPGVRCVRVEVGEGGLALPTYFACDEESQLPLAILRDNTICRYLDRLSQQRVAELHEAIRQSPYLGPLKGQLP
jgi:hypothetical protein